ncbi:hypothetical protein CVT26_013662 [Gymnopilus dilepis]|uniref:Uncharacterized protein n=1 Tax=Gymnopilus dilepis TaxID=231916 RepID=A0A409YWD5_9AGAR|nr:hypothetical protein CVT26_013662 [Gymnopilus dilepis]
MFYTHPLGARALQQKSSAPLTIQDLCRDRGKDPSLAPNPDRLLKKVSFLSQPTIKNKISDDLARQETHVFTALKILPPTLHWWNDLEFGTPLHLNEEVVFRKFIAEKHGWSFWERGVVISRGTKSERGLPPRPWGYVVKSHSSNKLLPEPYSPFLGEIYSISGPINCCLDLTQCIERHDVLEQGKVYARIKADDLPIPNVSEIWIEAEIKGYNKRNQLLVLIGLSRRFQDQVLNALEILPCIPESAKKCLDKGEAVMMDTAAGCSIFLKKAATQDVSTLFD